MITPNPGKPVVAKRKFRFSGELNIDESTAESAECGKKIFYLPLRSSASSAVKIANIEVSHDLWMHTSWVINYIVESETITLFTYLLGKIFYNLPSHLYQFGQANHR